ncbi:cysteinyl leukotriene receptor 1-like [Clupea harengus]|uniref:Cysteinyl leukotriene receptor 1-like n=1 Tax=Clupea harengus TaxID=7950 RepID=A0A6P8H5Z3_CLUHA|nr:cysteinyl leukotriene receptor 1-like [Clupea harengus]
MSECLPPAPMVPETTFGHTISPSGMVLTTDTPSDNGTHCPSIDDFRNQVYSTAYSIITVFGLVGNGFALFVLLRTFRQRSAFHIYMLNLALSDLFCVSVLPLRVIYYVNKGQWNHGDFLCRISSYTLYVNLYCSVFFMTAMSVTRFLAIVYPVQNLRLVTERKARIVCICIWVFICTTSMPFLMQGQHVDPITNKTKCFEPPERGGNQGLPEHGGNQTLPEHSGNQGLSKLMALNYFSLVVGFIIPFLVIMLCYAGITRALLGRTNVSQQKQRATRIKAIRMIIIVTVTFLVSFTPYHIQRTLHLHFMSRRDINCDELITMQKSVVVTLCLAASNSCFDPLLYFFSGENFRHRLSTFRRPSAAIHSGPRRATPSSILQPLEENDQQACNGPSQVT